MKGMPFAQLGVPRRTLYLQTVRTGATAGATDFGRIFDKADPGSIVGSGEEWLTKLSTAGDTQDVRAA